MFETQGQNTGRNVVTVLLSILLCVALLFTAVLTAAWSLVNSHNIAKLVSTLTIGDEALADIITLGLKGQEGLEGVEYLASEQVEHILREDFTQEFLSELIGEYVDALLNDKDMPQGAAMIADFLAEHEEEINEALAEAGFRGQIRVDVETVRLGLEEKLDRYFPVEILREQYARLLRVVRFLTSTGFILAAWGVCALLGVCILAINRMRLFAGVVAVAVPVLVVVALLLVPALLVGMITGNMGILRLAAGLLKWPVIRLGAAFGAIGVVPGSLAAI